MMQASPFLVGITGGIGSGKSMVCHFLAEMGCALFESDRVAKELQLHDPQVIDGIKALFGEDVYSLNSAGTLVLDRKKIASSVFASSEKRDDLNRLIHPKVAGEFHKAVLNARMEGKKILVKEAAILFESGGNEGLDAVVVVAADVEERIARVVQKGMGRREEIVQRIAAQWPLEKLMAKADYVLFNRGTPDELKKETESLYLILLAAAESHCRHHGV